MKKQKKVLHIVEAFGGGVFTVLSDLINGLSKDYEIIIAYSLRPQTPMNFEKFFNENVKFIEVKNFTRSINPKKDIKALQEIRKLIKEEKPDIIHLHSSKAGILGRLAMNGNKIKMFYNPHGFSFLKKDDSKLKRMVYWLIEKMTAMVNKKCTIVGCSKGEYEEEKKLNKNSICINNGIDIDKLQKETENLTEKKIDYNNIKICTVGRISFQKNPQMFNEIAKSFPDIEFTWIGDGELREMLTEPNIRITGWKTREEVLQILNNNDIFLLTSLWEGLPISLLEAMYLKKICIVSNVVGNKDVIVNGKNGFIANDLNEFKKIIEKIFKKSIDLNEIKLNAKSDIYNVYNIQFIVKQYSNNYERKI